MSKRRGNTGVVVILLLLLFILAAIITIQDGSKRTLKMKLSKAKYEAIVLDESLAAMTDTVEYERARRRADTLSLIAKIDEITLSEKRFKELYQGETKKVKQMNVNLKDLQTYVDIVVAQNRKMDADTVYVDSLQRLTAEYKDKWVGIKCAISRKGEGEFEFSNRIGITATRSVDRGRFLFITWEKKKTATWRAVSDNPNDSIISINVKTIYNN